MAFKLKPPSVRLDAATICQLRCPSCPTAAGTIGKYVGSGFLKAADFKKFIEDNPFVEDVELSNWGEIFLNPELLDILKYAYEKRIILRAGNGVNLNNVSDEVLEGLVKYQLEEMSCSIDGASPETYEIYRVRGDFDRVIANIKRINHFKRLYNSKLPQLRWQFVVFGHNEHEIEEFQRMAAELDMIPALKLNWDDLYDQPFSPVKDKEMVRRHHQSGAADRHEYKEKHGERYLKKICEQLWHQPQVNFDGKVLGCCVNHWGDFGNAFDEGFTQVINGEKMNYARRMLLGKKPPRDDIPCTSCDFYKDLQATGNYLDDPMPLKKELKAQLRSVKKLLTT